MKGSKNNESLLKKEEEILWLVKNLCNIFTKWVIGTNITHWCIQGTFDNNFNLWIVFKTLYGLNNI